MYSDIYELVGNESNTVILVVKDKDYFLSYKDINRENIEDLVQNYFKFRGRDGEPKVADVDYNANQHRIEIIVDVDHEDHEEIEPMSVPHIFSGHND